MEGAFAYNPCHLYHHYPTYYTLSTRYLYSTHVESTQLVHTYSPDVYRLHTPCYYVLYVHPSIHACITRTHMDFVD